MENKRKKLQLETKVDLVLLAIGAFVLIWLVTTHEEFRKGEASTVNNSYFIEENTEVISNLNNPVELRERLYNIISQELTLKDKNLEVLSSIDYENTIIVTFMYEDGEENYEGICQISKEDVILFKAVDKINKGEPFTLREVQFRKENIPSCTVIYGIINTPIIKSVNINFDDNTITNILLGDNINYSYVNEFDRPSIIKVEGLDEQLNVFYKWDKIYTKPV